MFRMLKPPFMKTADAISAFGSPAELARALQITRSAISQWGDTVPELRAYQIRELLAARQSCRADQSITKAA